MLSPGAHDRRPNQSDDDSGGATRLMEHFRPGNVEPPQSALWTVVLAGGEGERLRPLTERWLGEHRPKQYCTFVGTRSMLQHTVDRAERLSGADRMLIVAADQHETPLAESLDDRYLGCVIMQPRNRDTAPGIFLPLAHIMARNPAATVVLLPSDHFVFPEQVFLQAVRRAAMVVAHLPEKVVLLGARPDSEETEYGWIAASEPVGQLGGCTIRKVAGFYEKPDAASVRRLVRAGGLWSTMVIVARCQTLWELGWDCLPDMMPHFEELRAHLGTDQEGQVMASIYARLPSLDFSDQLLQRVPESLLVMELKDVIWSDWGSERRIVASLNRLGKNPSFPREDPLKATTLINHDSTQPTVPAHF